MDPVYPRALRRGDTIALVVPASPVPREPIERAIARLEAMDFRIKTYGDLYREYGYLAGTDDVRADELMQAFADPDVAAVFPARGGNGVTRLLDMLDYDVIRQNPKLVVGFSDMTALHAALHNRSGLITFHGPHPKDGIGAEAGMSDLTARTYWRALLAEHYDDEQGYEVPLTADERNATQTMVSGLAQGRLVGGNLALICAVMGTPYEIRTAGSILLLEDINEQPYRVDRLLSQLKLAGKLAELAGVVIGQFTDCEAADGEPSLALDEIFEVHLSELGIPVLRNFPTGHCRDNRHATAEYRSRARRGPTHTYNSQKPRDTWMSIHPQEPDRLGLAQLPTPIVELKQLAEQTGVSRILLKRDDLTGLEVSGNKIRKLEYVVADAIAQGADTLVTHGGFQSNHCRATAAVGARLGMRVRMILRSDDADPEWDGNLFLDQLFGADISYETPTVYRAELSNIVERVMQEERDAGRTPYFFPVGASVPYGSWGYVRCIAELVEQLGRETPVDVYCATSSGGTQVGLMLGRALLGCDDWRILGVPVSDSVEYFHSSLRELERATVEQFSLDLAPDQTPIDLIDGFIGEGYAIPYPEAVETIRLLGRSEGIVLDPSYTSKGVTGMLASIKDQPASRVPVYIHTGGSFGLFARRDLIAR